MTHPTLQVDDSQVWSFVILHGGAGDAVTEVVSPSEVAARSHVRRGGVARPLT